MVFISGCRSYHDRIALEEIDQGMSEQDEYRLKQLDEKKVPAAVGMIKEIEVIRGEQKYLYVALGRNIKGFKPGLYGYIYNDSQRRERVGKCKIVEVYSNISKAEITELNYKIDDLGVVEVEVDPRFYVQP